MQISVVLLCSLLYIAVLFATAWWVDRFASRSGRSIVRNPYIYSLSLAVYCTAWTFFGSVGRASTQGLGFLAIYLGPTLMAPLWFIVLRKMILISKNQRITSIADFISARFGKSASLATMVTLIAVLGIIPYISIQLKAVTFGINTLTRDHYHYFKPDTPFYYDAAFGVTIAMAVFTALFGTRKLDPNERHEGLVAAVALESLIKLVAFWGIGLYVTYGLYNGFGDLFSQAMERADIRQLFSLQATGVSPFSWNMLLLLSGLAILLLPRQFHIAVVENTHPRHITTAMWMFPLYLLLINVFVLPIALAGKMQLGSNVPADTFVLTLPQLHGADGIALLAYIGGFSAATSMVIVSSTALSIMISNHLVIPLLIRFRSIAKIQNLNGAKLILDIRRISIISVLLMAYIYMKSVGAAYDLVSVGLISFTAVAQFAPAALGGMYWKRATKQGAMAGLLTGFVIWAYTLPLTSIADAGYLPHDFVEYGPLGISWLKPDALFGLSGMDHISHAAFWSLLLNSVVFTVTSVYTQPSTLALTQADLFVNITRYVAGQDYDFVKRQAKLADLRNVLNRFLGNSRVSRIFREFEQQNGVQLTAEKKVGADLINFCETHLAGAIGAASARLVINSVATEENITLEEIMLVLEQTQEVLRYSRALETKSQELEATTRQLTEANEQLKALDRLKADFITTVTHELRTPVTSIKSLSKIILDYSSELDDEKRRSYLQILVNESDRIARLINQVLDIEKIQSDVHSLRFEKLDFRDIVQNAVDSTSQLMKERHINCITDIPDFAVPVSADRDRLMQVVINLLSNAIKFCDTQNGIIDVSLEKTGNSAELRVSDNGQGIPANAKNMIFDKFTQVHHKEQGKPQGTGLGLFITKTIMEQHHGHIRVESEWGHGASFIISIPLET